MELIAISEDTLVNPEKISVVEIRKNKAGQSLHVTVEGKTFPVEIPATELLLTLKRSGVNLNKQYFSV